MPNFRGRRFTNAHETMIWAARGTGGQGLHVQLRGAEGRQRRLPGALRLVPADLHRRRAPEGRIRAARLHPTQKPEALLARVLVAASNAGDLVLDPFFGSGTTGAVARRLRRSYIGIERDPTYAEAARKRIAAVEPLAAGGGRDRPDPAQRAARRLREPDRGRARSARRTAHRRAPAPFRAGARGRLARRRPGDRLDPQDRRAGPGPARLQRLDLLARRAGRATDVDRRSCAPTSARACARPPSRPRPAQPCRPFALVRRFGPAKSAARSRNTSPSLSSVSSQTNGRSG